MRRKILIDQGDIISAGGMMSWMDLGVALIQRFTQASIVRQLGKNISHGHRHKRTKLFTNNSGHDLTTETKPY